MQARNNPLLVFPHRILTVGALLCLLWSCATEAPTEASGPEITAEILTAGRVRADGQEMRTEDFLDLVRARVATAAGDETRIPAVTLIAHEGVRGTSAPARVFEALRTTGVRLVHLDVGW